MSTPISVAVNPEPDDSGAVEVPQLENGHHLDQYTYHERYKASPKHAAFVAKLEAARTRP